jgi:hypothetical protein
MCGRIIIILKKKRRIAIHHPTSLGDVIIIRNGAKTILFGRLNNYISIAGSFDLVGISYVM